MIWSTKHVIILQVVLLSSGGTEYSKVVDREEGLTVLVFLSLLCSTAGFDFLQDTRERYTANERRELVDNLVNKENSTSHQHGLFVRASSYVVRPLRLRTNKRTNERTNQPTEWQPTAICNINNDQVLNKRVIKFLGVLKYFFQRILQFKCFSSIRRFSIHINKGSFQFHHIERTQTYINLSS